MCGFTAQLVEHRTGVAEVTGSNPVEALIFFRLLPSNCLNWKFTAMITLNFHLQPEYNMHFIYISQNILSRKWLTIKFIKNAFVFRVHIFNCSAIPQVSRREFHNFAANLVKEWSSVGCLYSQASIKGSPSGMSQLTA